MKKLSLIVTTLLTFWVAANVSHGEWFSPYLSDECSPFASSIRPVTNPVYLDVPMAQTYVHLITMYQTLPNQTSTTLGDLGMNGDMHVFAVGGEYAFTERFSLVAAKDGYILLRPNQTYSEAHGLADLSAGFKYAFVFMPECQFSMAAKLLYEIPIGHDRVFQGNGSGAFIPSIALFKRWCDFQLVGTVGTYIPVDDDRSNNVFHSWHLSYEFGNFYPLVELTHIHTFNDGNGGLRFIEQAGGVVPAICRFEGGDMINIGASHGTDHADIVTLGFGFRYRFLSQMDVGLAFEFPLTKTRNNLIETRTNLDLVYRF